MSGYRNKAGWTVETAIAAGKAWYKRTGKPPMAFQLRAKYGLPGHGWVYQVFGTAVAYQKLIVEGTDYQPTHGPTLEHWSKIVKKDLTKKQRTCLRCGETFLSWGPANRRCGQCEYREGSWKEEEKSDTSWMTGEEGDGGRSYQRGPAGSRLIL